MTLGLSMVTELNKGVPIVLASHFTAEQLRARLRTAVAGQKSIGPTDAPKNRRLRGLVTDQSIRLWVWDDRLSSRRKSWNIEFQGNVSRTADGAVLDGMVHIPDRMALLWIMRLFRVGSLMPLAFVLALTAKQGIDAQAPAKLAFAILLVMAVWVTTSWMERSAVRAAAEDARLLVAFLRAEVT